MESITEDSNTTLKKRIEGAFLICVSNMTTLKSMMYNRKVGNIYKVFDEFKESFDQLFSMSSDNDKLNKEIVKDANDWLNKPTPCTPKIVVEGLDLFSKYKSELFKQNIIKV